MKIGIDITPAAKDKAGIGYLTSSMILGLSKIDTTNLYELFTNDPTQQLEFDLPSNFKITVIKDSKAGTKWMFKGAKYLRANNFDLFVSTSNFLWSIIYPKTLQFVHDIAPIKYPQYFTRKGSMLYSLQLRVALQTAQYVVTISQTVLNELTKINAKKNKDYILLGLHSWALSKKNPEYYQEIKTKYNLPDKYFVMVGTLEPRKNHINVIKGFKLFLEDNSDFKLVIVGKKGWFYEEIFKAVKNLNLESSVIFTGYAPEDDLPGLIDLSQAGLQLSFYEGFGLPIIEFSARNKPVLVSNIPVFLEVTKTLQNIEYADPLDPKSIENGMLQLLNKQDLSNMLDTQKYSWETFAKKLLDIITRR